MESFDYVSQLEDIEIKLLALFASVQEDRTSLVIDAVPPITNKCLAIEQTCQLIREQLIP